VARLLLFGPAREAAGTSSDEINAATVAEVLELAQLRYGQAFASILAVSQVWVNGEPTLMGNAVGPHDEVAVLPPISGG
jgi:molybdopterin converting factor small subunit